MNDPEIIEHLATMDLRRLRTPDLLAEADFAIYELADLAQKGEHESGYAQYMKKRVRALSDEQERRSRILPGRDTPVSSIPLDFIIEIKRAVDIEDIFNHFLGILCRPTGQTRSVYACPAHPDKHPSGVIYRDQGTYHCFQCGAHGDVFDCLMAFKGMRFIEAVDAIAGYLGRTIPRLKTAGAARGMVSL